MSLTLDLPELTTSELAGSDEMGVSGGWDESGSILPEDETRAFVNNSLANIQNFFSRMIQLDPQEDELFGETGRDVNGFRLTTEDEPPGVDHDTAISIRSDHISNLSIQSGKASTSDALLCMGTWDSTTGAWGVHGALRVDMSNNNAFMMESNYGAFTFNNIGPADETPVTTFSPQPAAILESVNALVLKNRPGSKLPDEAAEGAGFYAASGVPYAFDSSGTIYNLTTVGSGITVSGDYTITGDWTINGEWTFGSVAGFPELPATTTFTQATGTAPFTVNSATVVANLKSDTCVLADDSTLLGGVAASTYPRTNNNETLTSIWTFGDDTDNVPIKMYEVDGDVDPLSEPPIHTGYLYHNKADHGIYWMTHNTEGDHDTNLMATDASALYSGTATSSQNTDVEFLSITPTTPDQTYMVEIRVVGRGTAGDFDNGYVAFRAYNMFYTSTLGVFTADYITGASRTPGKARDGAGTIMDVNVSGGAEFIIPILIDASGNIQVKAHGYTDLGSPNSFSWKYWIKVYQV